MSIPQRTGKIETIKIDKFLEDLDLEIGEDIIMGDFDIMGWHLASKVRDKSSENYRKSGAIFRPNYERGILVQSLIQTKGLYNILEIGFGRGYVTACAALAIYNKGVEGKIVTVDPFHEQEKINKLTQAMSSDVLSMVKIEPVAATSDAYFEKLPEDSKFDLIFIDGDHRYDFVKRDFENAVKHIDRGYILMDDYHMPSKTDKDIEVANFVDSLSEEVKRKLVLTDRVLFGDDRSSQGELDYGMVLIPVGDIEDE